MPQQVQQPEQVPVQGQAPVQVPGQVRPPGPAQALEQPPERIRLRMHRAEALRSSGRTSRTRSKALRTHGTPPSMPAEVPEQARAPEREPHRIAVPEREPYRTAAPERARVAASGQARGPRWAPAQAGAPAWAEGSGACSRFLPWLLQSLTGNLLTSCGYCNGLPAIFCPQSGF